jgi:hypothetical protein
MGQLFKIIAISFLLLPTAVLAGYNEELEFCLGEASLEVEDLDDFDRFDWNRLSICADRARVKIEKAKRAEIRDFLKHNPRYRFPGQSLNKCFGKPREMPFESSYIKVGPNGMEAGVNYKDTLPAGCFENAPWDNRDNIK